MNVCHVTEASDPGFGGLYTATQGLVRALKEHQHIESVVRAGHAIDGCSSADLCHAHGMWAGSAFVIVAPHGMLDPWALEQSAAAKKAALATYEGLRLRTATCLHALCEAELASIRRLGKDLPAFVVPNGVDIPDANQVRAMCESAAKRQDRRTLLYLGRIHAKKGLELVLGGFASAATADPRLRDEWTVEICGSGDADYIAKLQRLSSDLGLSGVVRFAGPVAGEEKESRLTTATAFVLTSLSEGLPMAVLEAWAHGLPSLISEACNLSAPATTGAALLTNATMPAVTIGLGELLHMNENDRLEMGARARAYVERVHPWARVASRMAAIYRWAIDGGQRPDEI